MPTFYLQFGITDSARARHSAGLATTLPDDRLFIDDSVHGLVKGKNKVEAQIEADNWIEARMRLFL